MLHLQRTKPDSYRFSDLQNIAVFSNLFSFSLHRPTTKISFPWIEVILILLLRNSYLTISFQNTPSPFLGRGGGGGVIFIYSRYNLRGRNARVFIPISKYSHSFILLDKYSNFYYSSICFNIILRRLFSKNTYSLWDFPTTTSLNLQFPQVCYILCTPFSTLPVVLISWNFQLPLIRILSFTFLSLLVLQVEMTWISKAL
jgi:hypothetical protein